MPLSGPPAFPTRLNERAASRSRLQFPRVGIAQRDPRRPDRARHPCPSPMPVTPWWIAMGRITLGRPLRASEGMTDATIDLPPAPGVFAETRTGRDLMGVVDLRQMGQRSDLQGAWRFAIHLGCIATTGVLVWLALPHWYLLIPAMLLHGTTLVTMFAPMHECTHRTAFASPRLNDAVGWLAGVLSFYNSTFYRYFHAWHHRYTQDPARDPELMFPRASTRSRYLLEISTIGFWYRRTVDYGRLALGAARLPFMPESAGRAVQVSVAIQWLIYLVAGGAIALGLTAP